MKCARCKEDFPHLQIHHIHSISLGGDKHSDHNKTRICPNCHEMVHRGEIILEGNFLSSNGYILIWRHSGDPSITGCEDPPCYRIGKRL
jgi:hypothetical protein